MTDHELKRIVLDLICRRHSRLHEEFCHSRIHEEFCRRHGRLHEEFPIDSRSFSEQWIEILERVGCTSAPWSWDYPEEDTDDLFVRHVALGVIRVPREAAMKILVLGIP